MDTSDYKYVPLKLNIEYEKAEKFLYSQLSDDDDCSVVCVEHQRFIPCRTCMYVSPATTPYSDRPSDVALVQKYQTE